LGNLPVARLEELVSLFLSRMTMGQQAKVVPNYSMSEATVTSGMRMKIS
jgi:hypothetical protein